MGNTTTSSATDTDRDITSLRATLAWLQTQGDVLATDIEADPDLEITGLQKHLDGGPVILFNNVKGRPDVRAVTNLLADFAVIDKLFGFISLAAKLPNCQVKALRTIFILASLQLERASAEETTCPLVIGTANRAVTRRAIRDSQS